MTTSRRPRKPSAKPAPARACHKGNVAEEPFAAATRLIAAEGLDSIMVQQLCREVGVKPANFYNRHPSVQCLLLEVAATGAVTCLAAPHLEDPGLTLRRSRSSA